MVEEKQAGNITPGPESHAESLLDDKTLAGVEEGERGQGEAESQDELH